MAVFLWIVSVIAAGVLSVWAWDNFLSMEEKDKIRNAVKSVVNKLRS